MIGVTVFLLRADMCLLIQFLETRYEVLITVVGSLAVYFALIEFFPT